ncbi:DUF5333 domain-containing protein [uncultured Roseobacter sp.]|uniref:DUF5333 domain-containing protein n=1 Tax=uncultured Roseobacter sp. TaxID=114847 RepID=UPI0026233FB1|nr:DUF5333 domain-containing protein [uncultured Roseobacter sp.]
MVRLMVATVLICGLSGPALAKPALRDVPVIDNGLFAVALADQIRKSCPSISARFFRAYAYLRNLQTAAEESGYTRAEVEAHLDSEAEKERLRLRAASLLKDQGLRADASGYCALGRQQIAAGTDAGRLLREDR